MWPRCAHTGAFRLGSQLVEKIACCLMTANVRAKRATQDARPELAKMYRVPPDRAWWPAVGAPLERRGGRSRYAEQVTRLFVRCRFTHSILMRESQPPCEDFPSWRTSRSISSISSYFERAPQPLHEDVIAPRPLAVHADLDVTRRRVVDRPARGGQRDLQALVLRHVASAFAEDPVRVLRLACSADFPTSAWQRIAWRRCAVLPVFQLSAAHRPPPEGSS